MNNFTLEHYLSYIIKPLTEGKKIIIYAPTLEVACKIKEHFKNEFCTHFPNKLYNKVETLIEAKVGDKEKILVTIQ